MANYAPKTSIEMPTLQMDISSKVFDLNLEAELVEMKQDCYNYVEQVKKEEDKLKGILDMAKETVA